MRLRVITLILIISLACASSAVCERVEEGGLFILDGVIVAALTPPEEGVKLKSLSVGLGETVMCLAPEEQECTFSCLRPEIASVDAENVLTAHKKGETYLRATLSDGNYTQIRLRVLAAPTSVSLNAKKGTLPEDETYQLTAKLSRNSASILKWSSSDTNILQVDDNGLLYAINRGECTITVTTFNGKTAECRVTVTPARPAKVELNAKKGTLCVGESYQMICTLTGGRNETVKWVSGDERVLRVDENGLITAVATGSTRVRALASGGNYADCMVTVNAGSTGIRLSDDTLDMYEGGERAVNVLVEGGSGQYALISLDEHIVQISDDNTTVRALSAGQTIIVARTPNGLIDERVLTVYAKPAQLGFAVSDISLCEGDEYQAARAPDADNMLPTIYESDAPAVARVDDKGGVNAIKRGEALITARSGGLTHTLNVQVTEIASAIEFSQSSGALGVGDKRALSVTLIGGGGRVHFASGNTSVATVDAQSGVVEALSEGVAIITASLKNGLKAEYALKVLPAPRLIMLVPGDVKIGVGDSAQFEYQLDAGSAAGVIWLSGDEAIISIDENGAARSTGAAGHTYVSAQAHNGVSGTATIEVLPMPDAFEVNAMALLPGGDFDAYLYIIKGETHALSPSAQALTHISCVYESSYPEFAQVDERGVVTARAAGTSLVTVTSYNGLRLRVLVEVVDR